MPCGAAYIFRQTEPHSASRVPNTWQERKEKHKDKKEKERKDKAAAAHETLFEVPDRHKHFATNCSRCLMMQEVLEAPEAIPRVSALTKDAGLEWICAPWKAEVEGKASSEPEEAAKQPGKAPDAPAATASPAEPVAAAAAAAAGSEGC